MSFDVAIWNPLHAGGMPQTIEQVASQYLTLLETPAKRVSGFMAFAQYVQDKMRLTRNVPDEWRQHFFDFVGEARQAEYEVWTFTMPDYEPELVMMLMTGVANSLGLVMYIDSIGVAFLPGNVVLPKGLSMSQRQAPPAHDYTLPRNKDKFDRYISEKLVQALASEGFAEGMRYDSPVPIRELPIGQLCVRMYSGNPRRVLPGFEVSLMLDIELPEVEKILAEVDFPRPSFYKDLSFSLTRFDFVKNQLLNFNADADILAVIDTLKTNVLPVFLQLNSYASINNFVNVEKNGYSEWVYKTTNLVGALLVAFLARTERYDEIEQNIIAYALDFFQTDLKAKQRAGFLRLVDYLREQKKVQGW